MALENYSRIIKHICIPSDTSLLVRGPTLFDGPATSRHPRSPSAKHLATEPRPKTRGHLVCYAKRESSLHRLFEVSLGVSGDADWGSVGTRNVSARDADCRGGSAGMDDRGQRVLSHGDFQGRASGRDGVIGHVLVLYVFGQQSRVSCQEPAWIEAG